MSADYDRHLKAILEAAQAVVRGDFNKEVELSAEGIVGLLAAEVNQIIRGLRMAQPSLDRVTDETPGLALTTQGVAELMSDSTQRVLDLADSIVSACVRAETEVSTGGPKEALLQELKTIKSLTFDIISAHSYQDVARQELERMEKKLDSIRDALLNALVVMNIRKDSSPENIETKKKLLDQFAEAATTKLQKQDLVDELLSEFGL